MPPRTTIAEGRDHVMGLILSPTLEAGTFYLGGKSREPMNPQPRDPVARAKLAALSEQLTGVAVE